jgi:hypothetical protein
MPPGLIAQDMPIGTEIRKAMAKAIVTSSMVIGSASPISLATEPPLTQDRPRSP